MIFLALEYPQIVHSLILVSASYTFDDHAKALVREQRESAPKEWIDNLNTLHGDIHGANYANTLLDLWVDSVHPPNDLPFTPDDLTKINCPTLIVHGDRDEFFPVYIPVTMYQRIPQSQLCILPNSYHGFIWEISPTLFSTVLLTFLTKNPF